MKKPEQPESLGSSFFQCNRYPRIQSYPLSDWQLHAFEFESYFDRIPGIVCIPNKMYTRIKSYIYKIGTIHKFVLSLPYKRKVRKDEGFIYVET